MQENPIKPLCGRRLNSEHAPKAAHCGDPGYGRCHACAGPAERMFDSLYGILEWSHHVPVWAHRLGFHFTVAALLQLARDTKVCPSCPTPEEIQDADSGGVCVSCGASVS